MKPEHYPTEPAHLWRHFYHISQTPRPSGQEAALRDYLVALADESGHPWQTDKAGNLVIYVPGSEGREATEPVIIQNHMDMVTVKTDDKAHDFATDAISLQVEEGWLCADRTTLGADNGIGCAAAIAVMTDPSVSHPPLELLFTVQEETGLFGASGLDVGMLTAKRMLNLDTEDWGELFIGCSGGKGWIFRRPLQRVQPDPELTYWRLSVRGLSGGHSGIQIHQQLGNAIKLLGQWLADADGLGVQLCAFTGGVAHNVIPSEASLNFACAESALTEVNALNARLRERWLSYLPAVDQQLEILLEPAVHATRLAREEQTLLQQLLLLFPHGAQSYSLQQPADLVDLSINLAVVRVDEQGLFLETTMRFFNEQEALGLEQQVMAIGQWLQADITTTVDYPGWQPQFHNPLLDMATELYAELFDGHQPAVKALHAGLECGILKSKKPDVDMLSFGPTIRGAHSPSERLEIATVVPFWRLLTELLKRL